MTGRRGHTVETDRGELRAPLVVDGLGWRRVLSNAEADPAPARASIPRPGGPPRGKGRDMELWLDAGYVRAGYSWSFPAGDELRVGVGSFWPEPPRQGADRAARRRPRPAGPWLPGQLDPPPAAPGGRGRRLLRRRLGRALPAADRRGHPHRALLRAGVRPRAAGCARRKSYPRAGAGPLRRLLRRPRAQIPLAAGCPAGDGPDHPEPCGQRRRKGLREPGPEPLGVLPLPGDRAAVVRGRRRGARSASASASRRTPSSMAGSARLA